MVARQPVKEQVVFAPRNVDDLQPLLQPHLLRITRKQLQKTDWSVMDTSSSKMPAQSSLFQVYLRLRPVIQNQHPKYQESEPWLLVEPPSPPPTPLEENSKASVPTHVVLQPPNDSRKRAVEKFGFTKVFQEEATQLDIFDSTGTVQLVKNVLSSGRDGLVATLGVTGSGKARSQIDFLRNGMLIESRVTQSSDLVHNAASLR